MALGLTPSFALIDPVTHEVLACYPEQTLAVDLMELICRDAERLGASIDLILVSDPPLQPPPYKGAHELILTPAHLAAFTGND